MKSALLSSFYVAMIWLLTAATSVTATDDSRRLYTQAADGSISIRSDINEQEQEELRQTAVNLLAALYERRILPFSSPRYPHQRGVLDRGPLESFLDVAAQHVQALQPLEQ